MIFGEDARLCVSRMKNILLKNQRLSFFLLKFKWWMKFGKEEKKKIRHEYSVHNNIAEKTRIKVRLSHREFKDQLNTVFPDHIRISILVLLDNTQENILKDMISSVRKQTYRNWELCLADGNDDEHPYVSSICREYAGKDERIRYEKLDKNLGISRGLNVCAEMAVGEYIAVLEQEDLLHTAALFEVAKAVSEKNADFLYTDESVFRKKPEDSYRTCYKPDYSPDTLRSYNYIGHLTVFRKEMLNRTGGFRTEYDGCRDYDFILRLSETANNIVHIPKILYFHRYREKDDTKNNLLKNNAVSAGQKALSAHLERVGLEGFVENSRILGTYRIRYRIKGHPAVSIIIPNKDHADDLAKCIASIQEKTSWSNWEILIVENNSEENRTFEYYREIYGMDSRITVRKWDQGFNYAAICNFGAQYAKGDYLLFLNNDTEVITPGWIEEMLMFAQREDVGAVGAMLYYPDDTVQHGGIILGGDRAAAHSHRGFHRGDDGYMDRLSVAQNLSAVTAACLMMRKTVFDRVGGFDEGYAVTFNDVDLCMKIRKDGYLIVWTPYAELYHYECKSRGRDNTGEKENRAADEKKRFLNKWAEELMAGDPYYNPNLFEDKDDFTITRRS